MHLHPFFAAGTRLVKLDVIVRRNPRAAAEVYLSRDAVDCRKMVIRFVRRVVVENANLLASRKLVFPTQARSHHKFLHDKPFSVGTEFEVRDAVGARILAFVGVHNVPVAVPAAAALAAVGQMLDFDTVVHLPLPYLLGDFLGTPATLDNLLPHLRSRCLRRRIAPLVHGNVAEPRPQVVVGGGVGGGVGAVVGVLRHHLRQLLVRLPLLLLDRHRDAAARVAASAVVIGGSGSESGGGGGSESGGGGGARCRLSHRHLRRHRRV